MATPQSSHQSPRSSQTWISNSAASTSTSRMNDLPLQLSPAQVEAQQILKHLLSKLSEPESRYYEKYGRWAERHARLDDFCLRCVRPQVWAYLNGRWSLDALKTIAGDLRSDARAIYLNGVLGLDKRVRIYIGQASSLRPRIAQHLNFRFRRDNPSLHYHALQSSVYNAIGVLAVLPGPGMGNHTLPGMDDPGLLLNVLEMWMCLVFRSLPVATLKEWIPVGVSSGRREGKEGEFGGLNIRSPLDQGDGRAGWIDLSTNEDPLVREYLGVGAAKSEQPREQRGAETEKRKREYAEKARKLNQSQKGMHLTANTLVVFGMGVVLGIAIVKGFGAPVPKR
ncbi:uncharacterized protein EKO05_0001676 [Ascochyta rabiei]|uniref:uncharacterized protein n=1 Tax=Didymella rabiei TaxID=5454 RepID=UPI0021FD4C60|nr:uncharacterized protein EKO05_0001676 [Ascochyta rabiei]UPX11052.1 hypothetical protein EKO05_0001676 [Ascochyta rabiei]